MLLTKFQESVLKYDPSKILVILIISFFITVKDRGLPMYESPVTYLVISTLELGGRDQAGEKLKMHICKTFNIIFRPLVVLVLRGDLECLVQANVGWNLEWNCKH